MTATRAPAPFFRRSLPKTHRPPLNHTPTHTPTSTQQQNTNQRNSYTNTTAVISRISYIDGDRGVLRYRGYPIEELVTGGASFLEVAYLVLYGDLPAR